MRRSFHVALAVAASLVFCAAASAAYAPQLSVALEPATPSTRAAIVSTITQANGETASKTVTVRFPSGFTVPLGLDIPVCAPDQQSARACPDATKIGEASATASVLGLPVDLLGAVYFGGVQSGKFILVAMLDNQQLNQHVTVVGLAGVTADRTIAATFDNLPNQLTTRFTLKFLGDARALASTPAACGDYTFKADFTSQTGERAAGASTVTVAGCKPPKLVVSPLDFAREPASTRSGTTLKFRLTEAASVTITAKHGGKQAFRKAVAGKAGTNAYAKLGRGLKAGRYAIKVSAVTSDGRRASRSATLVLKTPKAKRRR